MTLYTFRYNDYSNKITVETCEIVKETATRYYTSEREYVSKSRLDVFVGYNSKVQSTCGDVDKYKKMLEESYLKSISKKEEKIRELKKTLSVLQDAVTVERKD